MRPTRPRKEWKNLIHCLTHPYWENREVLFVDGKIVAYPCYDCQGYGKVRNDEDYDIIEGYKLAPWYKCKTCEGTGKICKQQFMDIVWKPSLEKYQKQLTEYNSQITIYKSAVKKIAVLTEEERKILGVTL